MPLLSHPAFGPRTSIIYITAGALIDVWTGVWYFAFGRGVEGGLTRNAQFWLFGFFLTGLTLLTVGLLLGRIGRAARKSELPPSEAVDAEARIQATAAANPQPIMQATAPNMAPGVNAAGTVPAMMPAAVSPQAPVEPQYVPGVTRR